MQQVWYKTKKYRYSLNGLGCSCSGGPSLGCSECGGTCGGQMTGFGCGSNCGCGCGECNKSIQGLGNVYNALEYETPASWAFRVDGWLPEDLDVAPNDRIGSQLFIRVKGSAFVRRFGPNPNMWPDEPASLNCNHCGWSGAGKNNPANSTYTYMPPATGVPIDNNINRSVYPRPDQPMSIGAQPVPHLGIDIRPGCLYQTDEITEPDERGWYWIKRRNGNSSYFIFVQKIGADEYIREIIGPFDYSKTEWENERSRISWRYTLGLNTPQYRPHNNPHQFLGISFWKLIRSYWYLVHVEFDFITGGVVARTISGTQPDRPGLPNWSHPFRVFEFPFRPCNFKASGPETGGETGGERGGETGGETGGEFRPTDFPLLTIDPFDKVLRAPLCTDYPNDEFSSDYVENGKVYFDIRRQIPIPGTEYQYIYYLKVNKQTNVIVQASGPYGASNSYAQFEINYNDATGLPERAIERHGDWGSRGGMNAITRARLPVEYYNIRYLFLDHRRGEVFRGPSQVGPMEDRQLWLGRGTNSIQRDEVFKKCPTPTPPPTPPSINPTLLQILRRPPCSQSTAMIDRVAGPLQEAGGRYYVIRKLNNEQDSWFLIFASDGQTLEEFFGPVAVGKQVDLYVNLRPDGSVLRIAKAINTGGHENWENRDGRGLILTATSNEPISARYAGNPDSLLTTATSWRTCYPDPPPQSQLQIVLPPNIVYEPPCTLSGDRIYTDPDGRVTHLRRRLPSGHEILITYWPDGSLASVHAPDPDQPGLTVKWAYRSPEQQPRNPFMPDSFTAFDASVGFWVTLMLNLDGSENTTLNAQTRARENRNIAPLLSHDQQVEFIEARPCPPPVTPPTQQPVTRPTFLFPPANSQDNCLPPPPFPPYIEVDPQFCNC